MNSNPGVCDARKYPSAVVNETRTVILIFTSSRTAFIRDANVPAFRASVVNASYFPAFFNFYFVLRESCFMFNVSFAFVVSVVCDIFALVSHESNLSCGRATTSDSM